MSSKNSESPSDSLNNKKEDILSEFNIKGIIGKGTFSVVKLGENRITKEKVAIKVMQKSKIINQDDLIRIAREIEMLKKLKHPNVIKIDKILEDSKMFYIIMEYCENGELFNRIVERQRLTEDEAAIFYYQIISGLEYIHKKKIVHRDLKPENLLLAKNDILKIIDFGLSNYSSFNIMLATPCGSPCYASPEMVSGKKYNGFLIDIWSTGIILFAMICGYLPFEDSNNEILFGKILRCKINYPRHVGELPLDLMKKIIVPEPTKRITLQQIKEHPFFLKGKILFNQKYPDLYNNIDQDISVRSLSPLINNEHNQEKKENYKKRIMDNNYVINIENINNMDYSYEPFILDNIDNKNINEDNYKNEEINIKNVEFNNSITKFEKENTHTEKENININEERKSNEKLESHSSILNPDEIPMDSVPKDIKNEKKNKNIEAKDNTKKKKIAKEEEINSKNKEEINLIKNNYRVNNNYDIIRNNPINYKNSTLKPEKHKIKKRDEFSKNKKHTNDHKKKIPHNHPKIPVNNSKKEKKKKNEAKGQVAGETFPENKSYSNSNSNDHSTHEYSTTFNSNLENRFTENNNNNNIHNKSKYSIVTQEVQKPSYNINKTSPNGDEKNGTLINAIKANYLTNTAPKNNDKTNFNTETKYPHNNYTKINHTFIRKIINISKCNISNINKENEKNMDNDNYIDITPNYNNRTNYLNSYTANIDNNAMNDNYNKRKIYDIFNKLQLVPKPKKENNEQNSIEYFNSINISDNHSVGKKIIKIPINNAKSIQSSNKDSFEIDKYLASNSIKTKNISNNNSDRDYIIKKNKNNKKRIINIEKDKIVTTNVRDNTPSYDIRGRDQFFDSITINNNNSINFHEPKLYIYVENSNSNNNDNLKTYRNDNAKNSKTFFKLEKSNNNIRYLNTSTNPVDYTKKILNKRTITDIMELNSKDKYNNKYGIYKNNNSYIENIDDTSINKSSFIMNDNKKLIDKLKKKNTNLYNNKNIYINLIDSNNRIIKNNYTIKSNDIMYEPIMRNKDKNNKNMNNRSINIVDDYYNSDYNNLNSHTINNSSKLNTLINNKYSNSHNAAKTEINMDLWDFNKTKSEEENMFKNKYYNNNQRIRGKNINNINNYIVRPNTVESFDNIDYKIKLQKIQKKKTNISDTKIVMKNDELENVKYINPKSYNITNIEPYGNYKRFNSIITDTSHSPIIRQNNSNMRNYKKFVKQYNNDKS